ncbi:ATP-binding protein [Actinomadura sp. 6N118]|uniref:ATP-binding protein n=1 Tax=Actinomadura sp. 6N118 TaxID=3375151 RepID=UPI0037A99EC2
MTADAENTTTAEHQVAPHISATRCDDGSGSEMRLLGARSFPAAPEQVAEARRWFTERLGATHPACGDMTLLLSETFTNAYLHSDGAKIEVSVFSGDHAVRVEVLDEGGQSLPHHVDDACGEGGRGLPIIRALADEWGYERLDGGLKVWFNVLMSPA